MTKDDRSKLYPHCGKLYPAGLTRLAQADDYDQVRAVADCYAVSWIFSILKWFEKRLYLVKKQNLRKYEYDMVY